MAKFRRHKDRPQIRRNDPRNADEFIREWVESIGSVLAAERVAGISKRHLHVWFYDPDRRFNGETQLKLSRAADIPVEALVYRWTPIGQLDMWKWVDRFG